MERTLSIIKPDGVRRGLIGEVVKRLEKNELRIVAMKMPHMVRGRRIIVIPRVRACNTVTT